ncbi:signal peptide peptidase SppA, 67K type [Reticulomyxa filosa]|uniref:Signal peptide peptidase SppA, 67K type n=1 Tax=Reticulomyxa filosa TaxID=46433 RepID=X6M5A8_RETFI|nr:signal peptide peptidase SppA, 67K type [Reticulomyxa filosa]|eukprot:ETO08811.1 signal peptide peptidase SppA, 67K type [Reticulomyxa filosa]
MNKSELQVKRNVRDIIHSGPYMTSEALHLGLIDGVYYRDELYEEVLPALLGVDKSRLHFLYVHSYWKRVGKRRYKKYESKGSRFFWDRDKTAIALIEAKGAIIDGDSNDNRGEQITSQQMCRALRAVRTDKKWKGLLLHIDSPGGSVTACAAIHRELSLLRREGKPIVVVQSNVAAMDSLTNLEALRKLCQLSPTCNVKLANPLQHPSFLDLVLGNEIENEDQQCVAYHHHHHHHALPYYRPLSRGISCKPSHVKASCSFFDPPNPPQHSSLPLSCPLLFASHSLSSPAFNMFKH